MRATPRSIVVTAVVFTSAVLVGVGQSAAAAPTRTAAVARVAGVATATARTVNAAAASSIADPAPARGTPASALRGAPSLPSRPTGTARKPVPAAPGRAGGPNTVSNPQVVPLVAPAVLANFDGINQASGCGGCQPPDPNAAISPSQIVQAVNLRFQVTTNTGGLLCSFNLNSFLGTSDSLSDPRVEYDNVNARFIFVLTVVPASTSAAPALWLGATTSSNACGSWFIYRPTFSGGSYPAGTLLDYPILGQDRNAMLLGTANFTPSSGVNFTVFGVQKSAIYTGAGFSFSAFNTASLCAPVSNGGIPMISTALSYFLGSVPGTGYRLYNLTNSGGPGAVLTLQATISSAFTAPTRRVNQPGTTATLDPLDGRIDWSPVNDGNFIWFAHGIDLSGFPAVRYGAISIAGNTATVAVAFRSGTSDDFNPSVGVGNSPTGGDYIYLNWAYTDTPNGIATSDTVDSVAPGAGVPNLIGTGAVLVNGSSTTEFRFGDFSSVAIDPTNPNGSCALTAQQYFAPNGTWNTRLARVGIC